MGCCDCLFLNNLWVKRGDILPERKVKCPVCGQYGNKTDMIQHDKRYYHKEYCYDRYLRDKEATRIEVEQWNSLYKYIMKLHDLVVLPKGNITRLKNLRAGYLMKEGNRVRQWRTGPDYSLMFDAYLLAEDSIKWCIANKLNGNKDTRAINYGISIMIDKLNEANMRQKNKQRQLEAINNESQNNDFNNMSEVAYKPNKKTNNDISKYL